MIERKKRTRREEEANVAGIRRLGVPAEFGITSCCRWRRRAEAKEMTGPENQEMNEKAIDGSIKDKNVSERRFMRSCNCIYVSCVTILLSIKTPDRRECINVCTSSWSLLCRSVLERGWTAACYEWVGVNGTATSLIITGSGY